jgi:hypothetical protein
MRIILLKWTKIIRRMWVMGMGMGMGIGMGIGMGPIGNTNAEF